MAGPARPISERRWWPPAVFVCLVLVLFGQPLLGLGSLFPVDIVDQFAPWRSDPLTGRGGLENPLLSDTVTVHVHFASMGEDLRSGAFSLWDRSIGSGIPTLKAGLPVFNVAYAITPDWYAPGLAAALRTLTAAGLTYGLGRSLGLSRSASVVSGVAFAGSGFMIGWSAWPHTNVAALMPGLFWAVNTLVERPRPRVAVALGLVVGSMIWANFPTITAYALLVAGGYGLVGVLTATPRGERMGALARRAALGGWGLLLGVGLGIYHVLHFGENLRWSDTGPRERLPADTSLGAEFLPSFFLPEPYGGSHDGRTFWGSSQNWLEVQSYVGLSVVVLALLSFTFVVRQAGGTVRRSTVVTWWVIVVATAWIAYVGGPPTTVVNSLPFLSFSSVGRVRVITTLAVAVLAGVGVQAWLDRRDGVAGVDLRGGLRRASLAVVAFGLATAPFTWSWLSTTRDRGFLRELVGAAIAPVLLAGLVVLLLLVWRSPDRRGAGLAVAGLTVIVGADLLAASAAVPTVVERDAADLTIDAHRAAAASLEPGERMAGEGRVFFANTGQVTGLDDARGQLVVPPGWRSVFQAIDPDHFRAPGTVYNPWFRNVDIFNPALDRLGVGVWAADPRTPVVGQRGERTPGEDSVFLNDDAAPGVDTVTVPDGGLRAITVEIIDGAIGTLRVELRSGGATASIAAPLDGGVFHLDLIPDSALPVGERIDATFWFEGDGRGPTLRSDGNAIAFSTVAGGDGLTVVWSGDVVVYDRGVAAGAWIAQAAVPADSAGPAVHQQPTGIATLAPDTHARLGLPDAVPAGGESAVAVQEADGSRILIDATSSHEAIVVVPQPDFPGWSARVDGEEAEIIRVDGAFPGIRVPAGDSVIELRFRPTYLGRALAITLAAVLGLALTWLFDRRRHEALTSQSITTG